SRSVLGMLIAILFKQRDRDDLAVAHGLAILLALVHFLIDLLANLIEQQNDILESAIGIRLVDRLKAGIGAVEALHVNRPLLLPGESGVRKLGEFRFRLGNRNHLFAGHLLVIAEADEAPLERKRVDGPSAVDLGDHALLSDSPTAAVLAALEQQH